MSVSFVYDLTSNKVTFAALEQCLYQLHRTLIEERAQVMQRIFENMRQVLCEHVEQSILADRMHQYALQAQKRIEFNRS